ncbi:hypothetical protein H4R24_000845 [Coemansia sp. RSA 988]|nr:hypothetical protein H4R24_000845 [Coemansia sp. RSA 988]
MKLYSNICQVATVAALSLTCVLATPDTPGTKTFIISLATTDNGQLVPVVLNSNSNGLETLSMPDISDDTSIVQDTDADLQSLESSSILEAATDADLQSLESLSILETAVTDEQSEHNESANPGITETAPQDGEPVYDSDSDAEDNDVNVNASDASKSSAVPSHFSNALILAVALGISAVVTERKF